jgi:hypothetical protein
MRLYRSLGSLLPAAIQVNSFLRFCCRLAGLLKHRSAVLFVRKDMRPKDLSLLITSLAVQGMFEHLATEIPAENSIVVGMD